MIKCTKCGTENENGAKFCKSCGAALDIAQQETVSVANGNSTMQTIKKIVIWVVIAVISFFAVVLIVNFINDKKEDSKVRELRDGCANDNAQACYELGILHYYGTGFNSEKSLYDDEQSEALAKGCQLGNKDACREGGYHERGCELKDGESCYELAHDGELNPKLPGCQLFPESENCPKILKERSEYEKKYFDLACQYGYSQGCMNQ